MKRFLLASALASATAVAEAPAPAADPRLFAAPNADPSASPYACTVETLERGTTCVFESQAAPVADAARQSVENAQAAGRLADRLCSKASRNPLEPIPDPDVLATCKRSFVEKAMACGVETTTPLLDADGRFGSEFRPCYAALADVLGRARVMAASSAPCCRCLAASRCLSSGEGCNARAFSRTLGGAASGCAAEHCNEPCRAYLPVAPPPPEPGASRTRSPDAQPSPCFDPLRMENPCVKL
jgi:hypothetical protein